MSEAKWYVVHTYSGDENKVKANIDKTIENRHLEDQILEVRVPMQDVVEMKNGVQKATQKKMFPGYVLIHMIMNDDTWYVVRNTSGVTGFIGSSGGGAKPFPLQKSELDPILKKMGLSTSSIEVDYAAGDEVNVISGPFAGKSGKVESIDLEKETAKVLVDFLGNLTPMEIELVQLEKADL